MSTQPGNGYIERNFATNITESRISKLQCWMLERARHNRINENRTAESGGADLYYREVLALYYEFPFKAEFSSYQSNYLSELLRGHLGDQVFDPDVIGRPRYNAACAAVARAATRLEHRGLAFVMRGRSSHWAGINIHADLHSGCN